jgi:hypothetical protein
MTYAEQFPIGLEVTSHGVAWKVVDMHQDSHGGLEIVHFCIAAFQGKLFSCKTMSYYMMLNFTNNPNSEAYAGWSEGNEVPNSGAEAKFYMGQPVRYHGELSAYYGADGTVIKVTESPVGVFRYWVHISDDDHIPAHESSLSATPIRDVGKVIETIFGEGTKIAEPEIPGWDLQYDVTPGEFTD